MKIGLQTWGSEGDVRPFLALAAGLSAAGHTVTLAATSVEGRDYAAESASRPFAVRMVGALPADRATLEQGLDTIVRRRDPVAQLRLILKLMFEPVREVMAAEARRLCADNDLVVGHAVLHPLGIAAEQARRPYVLVSMVSPYPSRHVAPTGATHLPPWVNALWWRLGEWRFNAQFRPAVNAARRRAGLPPVRSFLREVWQSPYLNLLAASPTLCPPPPDWGAHIRTCGFFQPPADVAISDWTEPDTLRRFLEAGPPPVYLTFGSMTAFERDVRAVTGLLMEAARLAGCRALVQSDWERVGAVPDDPNVYRIRRASHARLFPRCKAVVHHGGAGTTHTALRHGCPSVVVVHGADQVFWGARLHGIGAAPPPLYRRNLSVAALAAALRAVLASADMQSNARRAGVALRAEDGVRHAVALIEAMARDRSLSR